MPKRLLFFLFVIVFLAAVIIIWPKKGVSPAINNFEECVAAGNQVLESYPRQCQTKDGRNFVETLVKEE